LAFFFGVALPNNPWIARWTCSRTSFWTTLMKLVGRGIRDPPFEFGAVFHNFQTPVQLRGMTEDCDRVGESRFEAPQFLPGVGRPVRHSWPGFFCALS
jgi:hypothetical protein